MRTADNAGDHCRPDCGGDGHSDRPVPVSRGSVHAAMLRLRSWRILGSSSGPVDSERIRQCCSTVSVTVTARPRGTRFTQPAERKRSSTARPSAPDKWWRCSVQSTQYRTSGLLPVGISTPTLGEECLGRFPSARSESRARGCSAHRGRRGCGSISSVTADEYLALQQAAHDLHPEATREMVVTRTRGA